MLSISFSDPSACMLIVQSVNKELSVLLAEMSLTFLCSSTILCAKLKKGDGCCDATSDAID